MWLRFAVRSLLFGCIIVSLAWASCDDDLITDPQDIVFPDSNVSYREHVQPFLNLTCAFSQCHDDNTRAANLALTSYANTLFNRPGFVVPENPESSQFPQLLKGEQNHPPAFQARVDSVQIAGIERWIAEGALNN